MQSGSQSHNMQIIWKLYMLGLGVFLMDWHKSVVPILSFVTNEWAIFCTGLYSISSNIRDTEKACTLTKASLSCIITAILLFGLIKVKMVLFACDLVYLGAIQHLFLSSGQIWAGFDDFFILAKKFC